MIDPTSPHHLIEHGTHRDHIFCGLYKSLHMYPWLLYPFTPTSSGFFFSVDFVSIWYLLLLLLNTVLQDLLTPEKKWGMRHPRAHKRRKHIQWRELGRVSFWRTSHVCVSGSAQVLLTPSPAPCSPLKAVQRHSAFQTQVRSQCDTNRLDEVSRVRYTIETGDASCTSASLGPCSPEW